jgi:hypothetical protein
MKRLVARLSGNAIAMFVGDVYGITDKLLDMMEVEFNNYLATNTTEIAEFEIIDDITWDNNIAFDLVPIYRFVVEWEPDERTRVMREQGISSATLVGTSCRFFPIERES